jgi:hypothetical protein
VQVPPGKTLLDIFLKRDWVADDKAKFECLDGPTPATTPDSWLSFCYNYRNLQRLVICQV